MSTITIVNSNKTEERDKTLTMTLRPPHWRPHDENEINLSAPGTMLEIGKIIRGTTRPMIRVVAYTTIYQVRIGTQTATTGDGSEYYTAVRGSYTTEEIESRQLKPEYVLRVVPNRANEQYPQTLARLARELDISRLIARLRPAHGVAPLCESKALCIEDVFVNVDGNSVIEVYPFFDAVTLTDFVEKYFYDSFTDATRIDYFLTFVDIAARLLHIVGYLNLMGIYHRDLHPDNILVQMERAPAGAPANAVPRVTGLRLYNFDISCALLSPEGTAFLNANDGKERRYLINPGSVDNNCIALPGAGRPYFELAYSTQSQAATVNTIFLEPSALDGRYRWTATNTNSLLTQHKGDANYYWPKLETGSCGNILMWMVDRDQMTLRIPALLENIQRQRRGAIAIRKTRRCFRGLKSVLYDMTSRDLDRRFTALHFAGRFEVLQDLLKSAKERNENDLLIDEDAPAFSYDEQ